MTDQAGEAAPPTTEAVAEAAGVEGSSSPKVGPSGRKVGGVSWGDLVEYGAPHRNDLNGVAQLFFDNAGTLLALIAALELVLTGFFNPELMGAIAAFPNEMQVYLDEQNSIIFERTIPGLGFSCFLGGFFYAYQALRLSVQRREKATALPYGINTPGAFAVTFTVLSGVTLQFGLACGDAPTDSASATAFGQCWANAVDEAWKAGIVTNFLVGLISVALSFVGKQILKVAPPITLLTSLAGIGIAFLGLGQVSTIYAQPIVGFLPLYLIFAGYFGEVDFGPFPKSIVVVAVGTILGWADQVVTAQGVKDSVDNVKWWGLTTGFSALGDWSSVEDYIGVVIPVALSAAAGTLMNVYSAKKAGDEYGIMMSMISDGCGTIIAAFFGCPFSTSVYIGHPAYKEFGAGAFYSALTGTLIFLFSLLGIFALVNAIVPVQAVACIILFVGLMICQEAISSGPSRQHAAFIFGLFPSICDWATQNGVNFATVGGEGYFGYVSLAKGALLVSFLSTGIAVHFTERDFLSAAAWSAMAGFLAAFGVIHQDKATVEDWADPQPDSFCFSYGGGSSPTDIFFTDGGAGCADGYASCVIFGSSGCGPEGNTKWRFLTAYLMVSAMALILYAFQFKGFVAAKRVEDTVDEAEMARSSVRNIIKYTEEEEAAQVAKEGDVELAGASPTASAAKLNPDEAEAMTVN